MIRKLKKEDQKVFIELMNEFYRTDAVMALISTDKMEADFKEATSDSMYLDGLILEMNQEVAGYCLLAKGYSTEAGGRVLWIEDIYMREPFRGKGLGKELMEYIFANYKDFKRYRLEVEEYNKRAVHLYQRYGFRFLPYQQMFCDL